VVTTGRLLLLAGGESKGADLTQWAQTVKQHCDHVYVYGRDRNRLQVTLGDQATMVDTLDEAFEEAFCRASAGDVILFSPACASFDQFDNYQKRGDHFIQLVEAHREV
jgi:UDP-N-acetylmuramoylalanine--D-glutamate ligase